MNRLVRSQVAPDFSPSPTASTNSCREEIEMPLTKANPEPRPLPLIADILESIDDSSDAKNVVYSNADIGVMPHFYLYCALASAGSRLQSCVLL